MRALVLALLLLPMLANAQPLVVNHSGYLLDAGDDPVTAMATLVFRIHSDATADAVVWTSDACSVAVAQGFYATVLGDTCNAAATPLERAHLPPGQPRWLEVSVDGATLTPRAALTPAPTAAQSADTQALITRLAAAGTLNATTNPVDWTQLKGVPSGLADGTDANTTYDALAGGGLALTGTSFGIAGGAVTNAMLQNPALTVSPGTGLTGGGSVALGATTTLSLGNTAVTPGTYTNATVTVDAQGRLTSAATGSVTSGTVTSIASGTGLTGGPITTSGTLSIAAGGVGATQLASDATSLSKVTGGLLSISGGNLTGGPFGILPGAAVVQTSALVREFSGTVTGPDNYPTCSLPAKIVTLGTVTSSSYDTFFDIEVYGSHRGFNTTNYFSYNKWVVMVGDKASSNRIASQDTDGTVDLWNGSAAGQYANIDVTSGFALRLRVNPHCGSVMSYTYVVRYAAGANFTPHATRAW